LAAGVYFDYVIAGVIMKGSCLCGTIVYEVERLDMPILHCHCTTCRKAHAAAFTSTAGVNREHFRWLQGEDKISAYESSPGKHRYFCSVCGSHLVASRATHAHVVLRVATLDEDPGKIPEGHFWTSQDVPWLQDSETVPSYLTIPEKTEKTP
jgi:hypothetical protein